MAKKSLKEQLMEAGFRSAKMENHRDSARGREKKQAEKQPDIRRISNYLPQQYGQFDCYCQKQ